MATDPTERIPADLDPSVEALGYDHEVPREYRALSGDLEAALDGGVRFDEYAQVLYATDGSIYQAKPAGVVFPRHGEDVRAAVRIAGEYDVPVLPRGAGSSLAGQTVGPGCVVLDLQRHMDDILRVDPEARQVTVQPGAVLDHVNEAVAEYGLKFAPDPASSNRATVGGCVGNNSTGAHSVRYGITDAYTAELDVVLADGTQIHTREVVLDSPEYEAIVEKDDREAAIYRIVRELVEDNEEEIARRYPELKRSVSGYNLQKVVYENEAGERVINLSKLFVGAEGTLGVVVEATLDLVSKPEATALALYCFEDLVDAMRAVPQALEYDVSAVELMDEDVFALAAESPEYAKYAEPIPERTAAALMLEFDEELVEDFEAAIGATNEQFLEDGDAFDVLEAYTPEAQADLWKLRKAAIPLLMSLEGDAKPYPFIEDASVPPAELAEYVQKFEDVLEDHGTSAAYFAHAGVGTLHIRPILSLKTEAGVETMHAIAADVTDIVLEHKGAFSGEHGDGLARTEFNPKLYGEQLWTAFKRLKTTFDPAWRFNPGTVVYREPGDGFGPADSDRGLGADMRQNLRYGPEYASIEPQTTLDFADEGGFGHLVELCNGCGTCRQTDSDVMCPTYRASREEIQSTRGRANMLRAALSGELPEAELYGERFQSEVLDLCVGCKGCRSDCPTGVDMAKLKTELKHQYHEEAGAGIRERLFANVDRLNRLGSAVAPLSNWASSIPGARTVAERTLGIASDRSLPTFHRETLRDWFESRGSAVDRDVDHQVLLFPDTYTNYNHPDVGKAAVRVLEAAGVHVDVPPRVSDSGRAAYSKGFLDRARDIARENAAVLGPYVEDEYDIVFAEPSAAVMFQDEYRDLFPGDEAVAGLADSAYGVMEYLDVTDLHEDLDVAGSGSLVYHGHCHQKATNADHHAAAVLRAAGFEVESLDSSCCGMSGSFGYEAEHYELSKAIGRILFGQIDRADGDTVVAPGASCRHQLGDRAGAVEPPHPIEQLAEALRS